MNKKQLIEYLKEQSDEIKIKVKIDDLVYILNDVQKVEDISLGTEPYILIYTEETGEC